MDVIVTTENKLEEVSKKDFYKLFSERLKDKKSSQLLAKLLSFIETVRRESQNTMEIPERVRNFMDEFEDEFQAIWNEKEEELVIGEGIERKLCMILYEKFIGIYPEEQDQKISNLFEIYDFLQPCHLEINTSWLKEDAIEHAHLHINKITKYKTPRDKLVSIINCCKFVSSMVSHSEDNEDRATGADDFLPCLIFIIMKAKPKNVTSDLRFIRDYRSSKRLRGLEEYYFTAFESAIEFVEHIDAKKLTIDPKEFEQLVDENRKKLALPSAPVDTSDPVKEGMEKFSVTPFDDKEEMKRFNVEMAERDYNEETIKDVSKKLNSVKDSLSFDPKKQKFYQAETGKLMIKEIDELLEDYKKLVNQHAEMCKKVEEINKVIEEKPGSGARKNGKKLWNLFKFK